MICINSTKVGTTAARALAAIAPAKRAAARLAAAAMVLLAGGLPARAVDITDSDLAGPAHVPTYHAFILGASDYANLGADLQLPAVKNDLKIVREAFSSAGFRLNPENQQIYKDTESMERDYVSFIDGIEAGDVLIVYFSGHGFSIGTTNWIASEAFSDRTTQTLSRTSYRLSFFQTLLERRNKAPGTMVMLIDACRTNLKLIDENGRPRDDAGAYDVQRFQSNAASDLSPFDRALDIRRNTIAISPARPDGLAPAEVGDSGVSLFTSSLVAAFKKWRGDALQKDESFDSTLDSSLTQVLLTSEMTRLRNFTDLVAKYYHDTADRYEYPDAVMHTNPSNYYDHMAPFLVSKYHLYEDENTWNKTYRIATTKNCVDPLIDYLKSYPWGQNRQIAVSAVNKFGENLHCVRNSGFANFYSVHKSFERSSDAYLTAVATRKSSLALPEIVDAPTTNVLARADFSAAASSATEANVKVKQLTAEFERTNRTSLDSFILGSSTLVVATTDLTAFADSDTTLAAETGRVKAGELVEVIDRVSGPFADTQVTDLTELRDDRNFVADRLLVRRKGEDALTWIENSIGPSIEDGAVGRPILEYDWNFRERSEKDMARQVAADLESSGRQISYVSIALPDTRDNDYASSANQLRYYVLLDELTQSTGRKIAGASAITSNEFVDDANQINIRIFGF